MLTDWTKILSACLQRVLLTVTEKLCHLKNFRPRYNPSSSHVANCPNPGAGEVYGKREVHIRILRSLTWWGMRLTANTLGCGSKDRRFDSPRGQWFLHIPHAHVWEHEESYSNKQSTKTSTEQLCRGVHHRDNWLDVSSECNTQCHAGIEVTAAKSRRLKLRHDRKCLPDMSEAHDEHGDGDSVRERSSRRVHSICCTQRT